jgi:hypothetical protein
MTLRLTIEMASDKEDGDDRQTMIVKTDNPEDTRNRGLRLVQKSGATEEPPNDLIGHWDVY